MSGAIAIILARAGSRGLAGKNWALVAGRPCVAWTIDDARRAARIERVLVSTDAPEVARCAREMGVGVIARPPELASAFASVDDAARHALRQIAGSEGDGARDATPIVILYANVPVRPPGLIDRAIGLLVESGCDSVQSYALVGKHHPWWTARVGEGGRVAPWDGDVLNHGVYRRQDLPPAFVPDGGVLCVTRRALELRVDGVPAGPHAFLGRDHRGVVSEEGEVGDIDTRIDLLVADAMLRERDPVLIAGFGG